MVREFIQTLLADYERLLVTRLLMILCLVGGLMMAVLILAILLMLLYPPYMWCVFGGFVILWAVCLLVLYGYRRIIKAEHQAQMSQLDSVERYVQVGSAIVTSVIEHFNKPTQKTKRKRKQQDE